MSQNKTRVHEKCEDTDKNNDPIILLQIVFAINFNFHKQKCPIKSFYDGLLCFMIVRQHKDKMTSFKDF